ncbi:FMN-binding negative transcriptional regulator [Paenisporosarcina sp. TG20]|uniref:FMN-binding negative transcriptional regulator n=1 Tax=Paenisporosarcina sp. TG20 TaxID=1211706 RepID=UPI000474EB24|nr:FMN-binding negative transcriptional regulator [Paenisporosarcina sp. TG20]
MYIPPYFKLQNLEEMHEIITTYGFATLTSIHQGSLTATHLPLLLNEDRTELIGHFAKGNRQWVDIEGQEVLVVFHGPHCYISPSWYETQTNVPTWNYLTVHVNGTVQLMKDEDPRLWQSMLNLTEKYEDTTSIYELNNVDPGYISSLSKGVVGFTISIDRIEGKAKLSQNHPKERVERVISALTKLDKSNEQSIAKWMEKKSLPKE